MTRTRPVLLAAAAALTLTLSACGSSEGTDGTFAGSGGKKSSAAAATAQVGKPGECTTPPEAPGEEGDLSLPSADSAKGKTFTAKVDTNCGTFTLELDGTKAPQTVASFVELSKQFYANTPCHRLTTEGIFVLQCGDATGTGQGGPGYSFGLENDPADGNYPRGTLAMARVGNDGDSNGSQFFVVTKDSQIPSDSAGGYSVFGKVVSGMDVVDYVASQGTASDGSTPAQPISILKITVAEKKA